jgi:hypothetical protein
MAGLVPAIRVFDTARKEGVDARDMPGHDSEAYSTARFAALVNFFSTRSRFSFDR